MREFVIPVKGKKRASEAVPPGVPPEPPAAEAPGPVFVAPTPEFEEPSAPPPREVPESTRHPDAPRTASSERATSSDRAASIEREPGSERAATRDREVSRNREAARDRQVVREIQARRRREATVSVVLDPEPRARPGQKGLAGRKGPVRERDFIVFYDGKFIGHYRTRKPVVARVAFGLAARELRGRLDRFTPDLLTLYRPVKLRIKSPVEAEVAAAGGQFSWFEAK